MLHWHKEARDLAPDPVSGARITRLSGAAIPTNNQGYMDPRTTPDGTRFASWRCIDPLTHPRQTILCHDLRTKMVCVVDDDVVGHAISPPWSGAVYYLSGSRSVVMRADLQTITTRVAIELQGMPKLFQLMSVSSDERTLLYTAGIDSGDGKDRRWNLVRVNLADGSWQYLFNEHRDGFLGGYYEPRDSRMILIPEHVWIDGVRTGRGVITDANGRNPRTIFTRAHHACWLTGGRALAVLHMFDHEKLRHLPERPDGELTIYPIDGSSPRFIPTPQHLLLHLCSSRCGRYVVCESLDCGFNDGPVPIIIVNVETGAYRTLVQDCGCRGGGGGDDGRQAKPYFTADSKHVIYTADPDGAVNVYAAQVPEGFLESLE